MKILIYYHILKESRAGRGTKGEVVGRKKAEPLSQVLSWTTGTIIVSKDVSTKASTERSKMFLMPETSALSHSR